MKRLCLAVTLLTLLLSACGQKPIPAQVGAPLTVTGDVATALTLTDYGDYPAETVTARDGSLLSCIPLAAVLTGAAPQGGDVSVCFVAADGTAASVALEQADRCYLRLSPDCSWECVAPEHPPQLALRQLTSIVVCSAAPGDSERSVWVNVGEQTAAVYSMGQLFQMDKVERLILEGRPKVGDAACEALSVRRLIPLAALLPDDADAATALFWLGDDAWANLPLDGFLEWRGTSADWIGANGRDRKKDVRGIWLDAPEDSVTDVAHIVENALIRSRVLVIELDGFGMRSLPLLAGASFWQNPTCTVRTARTVLPSVSNVALAAIVSGLVPAENGVRARGDRRLLAEDLFARTVASGKTAAVIEGESTLITLGVPQTLCPDADGDGTTDGEVFVAAKRALDAGTTLTFVHFHGFDDVAHASGPDSPEAAGKAGELAAWIDALAASFQGRIVITADHGQHASHSLEKTGSHGTFSPEDMLVPIITLEME